MIDNNPCSELRQASARNGTDYEERSTPSSLENTSSSLENTSRLGERRRCCFLLLLFFLLFFFLLHIREEEQQEELLYSSRENTPSRNVSVRVSELEVSLPSLGFQWEKVPFTG
jgi:hypothetical protein